MVKPGYKQTEVGVIPEDWEVRSAADLGEFRGGSGFPLIHQGASRGDFPFFKVSDMNSPENAGGLVVANHYVSDALRKHLHAFAFPPGSIMFAKVGAAVFLERKIPLLVPGCVDNNMAGFVPDASRCEPGFVFHAFRSVSFGALVSTTALPSLSSAVLRTICVAMPPDAAEQRAIAEALSDADALIESLETLVAKKRQIKQGVMQELLTGKRRLPGFSGEWETRTVSDLIEAHFSGPSPTCEERPIESNEEWGVLKTTAITWEYGWQPLRHKVLPRFLWGMHHISIRRDDVLVTKAGPRHRVGVTAHVSTSPERIVPSGKMVVLRPNRLLVSPSMMALALGGPLSQRYLNERTTGMAESQVNFDTQAILTCPVGLPSLEEQHAIATVLSDIDAELEALETKLEKARVLKQGMMQELLTGRTRLVPAEVS